jgi:hypothetical protein
MMRPRKNKILASIVINYRSQQVELSVVRL